MGTILDKAYEAEDERLKINKTGSSTGKKNDTAARYHITKKSDNTRLSKHEISMLIFLTHEALEGRYDLTGSDLYDIHSALCELQ